jgi:hypothetical protein
MSSAQDKAGYGGTPAGGRTAQETGQYREPAHDVSGYGYGGAGAAETGFTVLAGALMILGGLLGFFEGLVAIIRQSFYHTVSNYTFQFNVHGWGWITLILGVVVAAAGVCVLLGQKWAMALGIVLAVFGAIANFLFIPYYPIWSIIVIAMNIFIIWALASGISRRTA